MELKSIRVTSLASGKTMLHLIPQQKLRVCLDRTNWKFGVVNINVLMLAVVHKGVAIPLAFVMLDKQGNSNTAEREALLRDVLAQIPPERIEMFTADREFVGKAWLTFLCEHDIPFTIRIRGNMLAHNFCPVKHFFNHLPVGQSKVLEGV